MIDQVDRLDYQPLFGRGARAPPRSHGWTREDSFVSLSQSDNRPQIFVGHKSVHKLSRQNTVNKMADDLELMALARERILETFHIESLKDLQREALEKLICGRDVFLIQPTGSGKSLIFQSAPIFFDIVRPKSAKSIVLVISPLVSLMLDQVHFLKSLGISAEIIGDEQNCEQARKRVERGQCQIVYGSPEAFLSTKRWRAMLSNDAYKKGLCLVAVDEAHCISHW